MIDLKNIDLELFDKVFNTALEKADDSNTPTRWKNAIRKAKSQLLKHSEFMTWFADDKELLIFSQESADNGVYTSNGVCECKAFFENVPCWHRALSRMMRNYYEAECEAVKLVKPCERCLVNECNENSSKCDKCEQETAIYAPTRKEKKVEKIGNYRI